MPLWTGLGDGIRVRQSRAYRMNSTLLLDPEHAVLVDPGVLPSELDDLAAAVREASPRALTIVFTHAHWDHVLGRPWWPEARTLAHADVGPELRRERETILREAAGCAREHSETWTRGFEPFEPGVPVRGEATHSCGPWRLAVREAPGHSDTQLTTLLPERRVLIAGDMLSDIEIPWLDREPAAYRRTLEALLPPAGRGEIETLVPGHGSIARGTGSVLERLRRDLDYLAELESGAREARAAGLTLEETQARLASVEHPARGGSGMAEVHRENVRFAWERVETGSA
jgi:glyoxylase-like metal-dependent hydrolase (beta-lactamase superfamily II)